MRPGRSLFLGALVRFDYEAAESDGKKDTLLLSWYGVLPGHLTSTERKFALAVVQVRGSNVC